MDEVQTELTELGLAAYSVVIAHGPANNFKTFHGDLAGAFFEPLVTVGALNAPTPEKFGLFLVPRVEGTSVPWRPILLGHEVAHVAVREYGTIDKFDLLGKFLASDPASVVAPGTDPASPETAQKVLNVHGIARAWAAEILCDVHALNRFGPAAIAALAEYFLSLGPTDSASASHPPTDLRLRILLDLVGPVNSPRVAPLLSPWDSLTPAAPAFGDPVADHLAQLFLAHEADLLDAAGAHPTDRYQVNTRDSVVETIADAFEDHLPAAPIVRVVDGSYMCPMPADVVNAAWVARSEDIGPSAAPLAEKTLEDHEFVRRWVASGGSLPLHLYQPEPGWPDSPDAVPGASQLKNRLKREDDDALKLIPILHDPKGVTVDLRLGNRFIVFRRTSTAYFDPLELESDPRSVQVYFQLNWNEDFVLHPNEMVLGATLEYMRLPRNLAGQVMTRSSYGRLGLMSATAVQIHPHFRGCLTLELVNLSTIPIRLSPGERVAQLVLSQTATMAAPPEEDKYRDPIGPQFSKVRTDTEAEVIRGLRSR
jgi:deoxycytidine triphosphate deaminase